MNQTERVTDFKLEDADGKNVKLVDLIQAIKKHCKAQLEGESFCCSAAWEDKEARLPERFRWLVAYAVEGENEGWYVHVGAIVQGTRASQQSMDYIDFGFAKVWSVEASFAVQKEAQRFLTAARWN